MTSTLKEKLGADSFFLTPKPHAGRPYDCSAELQSTSRSVDVIIEKGKLPQMNWSTIGEGIVTGVSASVAFAVLLAIRIQWRNLALKKTIRKGIDRGTIGAGVDGLDVRVFNDSPVEVIVRSVALETKGVTFNLNPSLKGEGEMPASVRSMAASSRQQPRHGQDAP